MHSSHEWGRDTDFTWKICKSLSKCIPLFHLMQAFCHKESHPDDICVKWMSAFPTVMICCHKKVVQWMTSYLNSKMIEPAITNHTIIYEQLFLSSFFSCKSRSFRLAHVTAHCSDCPVIGQNIMNWFCHTMPLLWTFCHFVQQHFVFIPLHWLHWFF